MYRQAKKLNKGLDLVRFFTINDFDIVCDNYTEAVKSCSPKDHDVFLCDPFKLDLTEYGVVCVHGFKKFFLKEDDRDTSKARKQVVL